MTLDWTAPIILVAFIIFGIVFTFKDLIWKKPNQVQKPRSILGTVWKVIQVIVLASLLWGIVEFFLHGPPLV